MSVSFPNKSHSLFKRVKIDFKYRDLEKKSSEKRKCVYGVLKEEMKEVSYIGHSTIFVPLNFSKNFYET